MPKMAKLASTLVLLALATTVANAQAPQSAPRQGVPAAQILATMPANSVTITHWYKKNVYDPGDNKIGEIMDVLVDREGKATALIIGVGGFLGMGEKDVAVPFNAVHATTKDNNKWYDEFHQRCSEERKGIQIRPDQHDLDTGGNPGDHGQPQHIRP
jgi:sporulation protein YlmC with PRC-barrel domain